jgi:hypothetical protein
MKYLGAAALVLTLATPAMAQGEFWVVMNPSTKTCTVVQERPTASTTVRVMGDGRVYKTRTEAEGAVKEVCHDSNTGDTTTTRTAPR